MKDWLTRYTAIGIAGAIGAIARYVIGLGFGRLNLRFPLGTFFINISGSLFLGWFLTHIDGRNVSPTTRLAIAVGFVGAYTTFSTFMYESNQLAAQGSEAEALANIIGSVVLGLLGRAPGNLSRPMGLKIRPCLSTPWPMRETDKPAQVEVLFFNQIVKIFLRRQFFTRP